MSTPRPSLLDEEDPLKFLDAIAWGWRGRSERLLRLRFYPTFLDRLLSVEESHGLRDGLIGAAAQTFGTTIRAIRRDLRAMEDRRRLEMIHRLPAKPPTSAP